MGGKLAVGLMKHTMPKEQKMETYGENMMNKNTKFEKCCTIGCMLIAVFFLFNFGRNILQNASFYFRGETVDLNQVLENKAPWPKDQFVTLTVDACMDNYAEIQHMYGIIPMGKDQHYILLLDDDSFISATVKGKKNTEVLDRVMEETLASNEYRAKNPVVLTGKIKSYDAGSKIKGYYLSALNVMGVDTTDASVVRMSILDTTETRLNGWLWFLVALAIACLVFCVGILNLRELKKNTAVEDRVPEENNQAGWKDIGGRIEESKLLTNHKRKLVIKLVFFLLIAFSLIGYVLYMGISLRKEEGALELSELVLNGEEKEGQFVKVEFDALPVLIMSFSDEDSSLYYITDVNDQMYIVRLTDDTYRTLAVDKEADKLRKTYQVKGYLTRIDDETRKLAIANSFKIFRDKEFNGDNFSEYLGEFYVKEKFVTDRMAEAYKILAFTGVFFLVMALLYVLPSLVKASKGDFGIYDEKTMMQSLEKYLPEGELLTAAVHSMGIKTEIKQVFRNCIYDNDDKIIPCENGAALQVSKGKVAKFEVYVGITQHYLVLSECKDYKHYYEFDQVLDTGEMEVQELDVAVSIKDIGTCFPLSDIQDCKIKNAMFGNTDCMVTMKNGSFIKVRFLKNAGPGMPHHARYREAVIARLKAGNV